MTPVSTLVLIAALVLLIGMSAYFSGSETAMMSLNRYRLRHLVGQDHAGAKRADKLLSRPDRLIGLILLGNNFVNILATQIATILTLQYLGQDGLIVTTVVLTAVILIFAEVLPKTVAAANPERIAFPSTLLLQPLLWLLYPFVWIVNGISNGILRWFDIDPQKSGADALDRDELRSVLKAAGTMIPHKHRQMLFGILDLEHATVEDIMVPRAEIDAIDLEDDWVDIVAQLTAARHTRVPCFRGSLDNLVGILHVRALTRLLRGVDEFGIKEFEEMLREPYFVPTKTNLHTQLINFQRRRARLAMAVDEYGDIEGLVTIDDLLEEVVGEFTTDVQNYTRDVYPQDDGTFLVDGSTNIRELNRAYNWDLPEDGPKTLNGLILQALEDIPETGTSLRIGDFTIEIVHGTEHVVKNARITPPPKLGAKPSKVGNGATPTRNNGS
ncbi:MAG: HlyC/CorC family transporter [Proteobacteria bacterium]|nr:MAG: HlyC/CorC family transporter [Pseudomonadota bacterium]